MTPLSAAPSAKQAARNRPCRRQICDSGPVAPVQWQSSLGRALAVDAKTIAPCKIDIMICDGFVSLYPFIRARTE
jgi:hypothetical protein